MSIKKVLLLIALSFPVGVFGLSDADRELFDAVEANDCGEALRLIMHEGANVNVQRAERWDDGRFPLHVAAAAGNAEMVRALLHAGAGVDEVDGSGYTSLEHAATAGNSEIIRVLIHAGADLRRVHNAGLYGDRLDRSILYCAVESQVADCVQQLIELGADVGSESEHHGTFGTFNRKAYTYRWNLLHYAARLGNVDVLRVLVEAGIDFHAGVVITTESGEPPSGVWGRLPSCALWGSDGFYHSCPLISPLHIAVVNGNVEAVRYLVGLGANERFRDSYDETPLYHAIRRGGDAAAEMVALFLEDNPAMLNYRDLDYFQTGRLLHDAVYYGRTDLVRILLERGAEVHGCRGFYWDTRGFSSFMDSLIMNVFDGLLRFHPSYDTLIYTAVRASHLRLEIVDMLIDAGVPVDTRSVGWFGCATMLHYALRECSMYPEIIERLLRAGAQVNAEVYPSIWDRCKGEWEGATPLHIAVRTEYRNQEAGERIVRMLLDGGADVNHQDRAGRTALHYAAERDNAVLARMLLDAGADVNLQDGDGRTALHDAIHRRNATHAQGRNPELVRMLLDAGADLEIVDQNGVSPLDLVITVEMHEAVEEVGALLAARDMFDEADRAWEKDIEAQIEAARQREIEESILNRARAIIAAGGTPYVSEYRGLRDCREDLGGSGAGSYPY